MNETMNEIQLTNREIGIVFGTLIQRRNDLLDALSGKNHAYTDHIDELVKETQELVEKVHDVMKDSNYYNEI